MSSITPEELLRAMLPVPEEPEMRERHDAIVRAILKMSPWVEGEFREQGRLVEARSALRLVLDQRELDVSDDERARIEACPDLATLERWLKQAVTAASAAEALR